MKRIDTLHAQANKFGTGKNGFQNGRPEIDQPATRLDATWFDHIQEEIANVIEGAGATINPARYDQLRTAIAAMIAASQQTIAQATEDAAGIAEIATVAEALAGTDDARFITPLKLKQVLALYNAGVQLYTVPGSFNFTVPTGITQLRATVIAGGGGGGAGGAFTTATSSSALTSWGGGGGGGGGGGYARRLFTVTPGQVIAITVGAGGLGGLFVNASWGRNADGLAGGISSVGSFVSALGGGGGGGGWDAYINSGAGGASGPGRSGSGGDSNASGGNGGAGAAASTVSGNQSVYFGAPGAGGTGHQISGATYGAGGAGAGQTQNTTRAPSGGNGAVLIEWGAGLSA